MILSLLFFNLLVSPQVFAESTAESRPGIYTAAEAERVLSRIDSIDPNKDQHRQAVENCREEVKKADLNCAASQNKNAQNAQSGMNAYATQNAKTAAEGADTGAGGQGGRCGDFGGLMDAVSKMSGAYKNECDTARNACPKSCKELVESAASSCASIVDADKNMETLKREACRRNAEESKAYAAKVTETCGAGYKPNSDNAGALMSAAMGVLSSMMSCQQDVAAEPTQTPERPCTLSADPSACTRSDSGGLNGLAKKMKSDIPGSIPGALPDGGLDATYTKTPNRGGATPPYAPGSGGTSASGKHGGEAKGDTPGAKPLNTNIYAGDHGGGGGRGIAGGGYPDAPEGVGRAIRNADLRKTGISSQFTGGHGRSNWQKVNERYKDNSPTLSPNAPGTTSRQSY